MHALARIIDAAAPAALDTAARSIWSALARGEIDDDAASDLAARVERRRGAVRANRGPAATSLPPRSRRRPERSETILRRRRVAACGALPPNLAANFSMAELAALAVVAAEVRQHGKCALPLAAVGARAGCSRTSVQNALRHAARLGLVSIEERRIAWNRNAPNIVRIIDASWRAWLARGPKGGGFKNVDGMNTKSKNSSSAGTGHRCDVVSGASIKSTLSTLSTGPAPTTRRNALYCEQMHRERSYD